MKDRVIPVSSNRPLTRRRLLMAFLTLAACLGVRRTQVSDPSNETLVVGGWVLKRSDIA